MKLDRLIEATRAAQKELTKGETESGKIVAEEDYHSAPCSTFFSAKVAFEIPVKYEVEGIYTSEIPEELVDALMDLFSDCEFNPESICAPPLLVVNVDHIPTPRWVKNALKRINKVLQNKKL